MHGNNCVCDRNQENATLTLNANLRVYLSCQRTGIIDVSERDGCSRARLCISPAGLEVRVKEALQHVSSSAVRSFCTRIIFNALLHYLSDLNFFRQEHMCIRQSHLQVWLENCVVQFLKLISAWCVVMAVCVHESLFLLTNFSLSLPEESAVVEILTAILANYFARLS